ncbi:restriction endonuclease subunit S [Phaeobacter gallaeciensis]|uniref:restriction endonuclease subunit S n=1 Tax=Phaeobacter gallaeciensis TaxID=60890 RepID=UPI00238038F8|nr:restriction endonuclease subunit S [Phaeobacter gallaeciensis]MDE4272743.1 restriction endonuclease subunit S [Phaeobacter gallaeciensis]MDE4298304.1 restriction endonuclease subunit S [Phaeobacter gallaeciensis]MDE5183492.1 restriction endonuclease subunit S [Phaeobacter gallaeciensis]
MSELPQGWAAVRAEDACAIVQSGGTPKKDGFTDKDGVPFLKVYNIVNQSIEFDYRPQFITVEAHDTKGRKSQVVPGDVLMNIVGPPLGKVAIVPNSYPEWNCNQALTIFRPSEAVSTEWLYHFLRSGIPVSTVVGETRGVVGQVNISLSQCRNFNLPIAPLPEQRRIVAKLDRLSARSAAARDHLARTTKLAARAKQAILSSALAGELTRSWRAAGSGDGWTDGQITEIEAQRAAYAKSRRGSRLESDSGLSLDDLGALPESWFPCHLAEVADIQVGHAFKSAWFTTEGPLLVRGANVAPGALSWDDTKRLDPMRAPDFERFRLHEGDIVLAMDRPLISTGLKIARVDASSAGALLVQRVARITERSQADLGYLWHVLNSRIFIRHAIERATGGDLPHISGNDILTTPVPLPPLDEQKEILRRVEAAFARIDRMTEEANCAVHLLDRLDERLLAKAFRGELVPPDPDDEPAEALLARIREARAAAPKPKRGRKRAVPR